MLRVEANESGHRFFASGDTAIVVWREPPTLDAIRRMVPFITSVSAECRAPVYVLVVIEETVGGLSDANRTAMSESMAKTMPLTRYIASVILGQGFRAAAIRSIASAMQLLARKSAPMKVFSAIDEAIAWLVEDMRAPSARRDELAAAVLAARTGKLE